MSSNNIRVVVRIRPENEVESAKNHRSVVRPMDERVLVFDPKEETPAHFFHGKVVWKRDITKRKNRDLKFAFDHVFASDVENQQVFEGTVKSVLDGVLNGYNCSVFAYGATGAGKTHTMLGKPSDPGVMFLTVMELYQRIEAMKSEKNVEVAVSYLEVYNEQIRDLLLPNGTLPIREDSERGVVVRGLSLHKPRSADELMHMLGVGNSNRTQHPTDANSESSRSHAVFQVFVRQTDRTAGLTANMKMAKLSLIDLAGSERATVTRNMGMRFREGANINRSLLALGNVINALAETKVKSQHVPYRNSKLTRLLKDSLGGNCHTVMIAAISPSSLSYEDTYNTLKYADRAKHIKAELKENVLSVDMHVSRYAQIVEELRKEIVELKAKLKVSANRSSLQQVAVLCPKTKSVRDQLTEVFMSRISVRKELLEFESSERDIQWKIHCKTRKLTRLALIATSDGSNSMAEKIQRSVETCKRRLSSLASRKESAMSRLQENSETLTRIETEISAEGSGQVPQLLEQSLRQHQLEVEVSDYRRYNKYLRQTVRCQEREMQNNDRLIGSLLQMVKRQYFLLKGNGIATSDLTKDFTGLQQLIDGRQEVRWADQSPTPSVSLDPNDPQNLLTFSLLASYNTPPTPRSICRSTSSYSSSPRPVNSNGVAQSLSSPFIGETGPLREDVMSRLQVPDAEQPGISPPVTQYAGRTPSAKHFLVTHSQKSDISDTGVKVTDSHKHELDVTYVCRDLSLCVEDCPVNPQHPPQNISVATENRTDFGTGTVTKSRPMVNQTTETVTESARTVVSQATVTKPNPVHVLNETVTKSSIQPTENHKAVPHAARAMKFDSTPPTPKSDMSFADAVKSPARIPLRSLTDNCMSPLALPLNSPKPDPKQRIAFSGIENIAAQHDPSNMAPAPALRRTGFPSLFSQTPDPKLQPRRVLPRYMQTTKAVTNRASRVNSYSRLPKSQGPDENQKPGRCARVDSSRTKTLDRYRSKSVPSLRG